MRLWSLAALAAIVAIGLPVIGPPVDAHAQTAGALDPSFANASPNSSVRKTLVQPDGKVLVGGAFTQVAGQNRLRVARLNADGSLDPSFANPQVGGQVWAMALQPDGKILIGGDFKQVAGQNRTYVARLNADGSLDTTFNAVTDGTVYDLALLPDGKVVVGGAFKAFKFGQFTNPRLKVARLNANGTIDLTFGDPGIDLVVFDVTAQPDGSVLVSGHFGQVGGQTIYNVARLTSAGKLDAGFKPATPPDAIVYELALQPDGKVLMGGDFAFVNGTARNRIARVNANGTLDPTFPDANPNGGIDSVTLQDDGKILIGGTFSLVGATPRSHVARLNADASLDTSFAPQPNGTSVSGTTVQADGNILISGSFTEVEGQPRSGLARVFGTSTGGGSGGGGSGGGPTPTPADALSVAAVKAKVSRRGAYISSRVKVTAAGTITQQATTGLKDIRVRCSSTKTVAAATTSQLKCNLGRKGRRSLRKGSLKLTLRTTFTPVGGTAVFSNRKITLKRKR